MKAKWYLSFVDPVSFLNPVLCRNYKQNCARTKLSMICSSALLLINLLLPQLFGKYVGSRTWNHNHERIVEMENGLFKVWVSPWSESDIFLGEKQHALSLSWLLTTPSLFGSWHLIVSKARHGLPSAYFFWLLTRRPHPTIATHGPDILDSRRGRAPLTGATDHQRHLRRGIWILRSKQDRRA